MPGPKAVPGPNASFFEDPGNEQCDAVLDFNVPSSPQLQQCMVEEDDQSALMTTIGGSVKGHDGLMQAYKVSTERARQQKRERMRQALLAEQRSRGPPVTAFSNNESDSESESDSEEDEAGPEQIDSDEDNGLQDDKDGELEEEAVTIFHREESEDEVDEFSDEDEREQNEREQDEREQDEEEKEAENQQYNDVKLFSSPSAQQNAPLEVPLSDVVGRCKVKRIRGGKFKSQSRRYELWCEGSNVLLMTAVKQMNGSIAIFDETRGSIGAKFSKKNGNYLGKLKGNRGRNMFNVVGNKKGETLGCVHCRKSTKNGVLKTAQLSVMLPPIGSRARRDSGASAVVLTNKAPQRTQSTHRGYRLNFGGRVKLASVKNFQIIADHAPDDVLMQFGKVAKDEFICDYQMPFTPVQAFAVCLIQMR
jgi:hypothetical protein